MKKSFLFFAFVLIPRLAVFSQENYEHKKFKILGVKELKEKYSSAQIIVALDVVTKDTCNILDLQDTLKSHKGYAKMIVGDQYDLFVRDIFKNMPLSPTPIFIRLNNHSYVDPGKLSKHSYFAQGLIGSYLHK